MREPAKNPCGSCPYRQDVPSGVWAREEYEKLPRYDADNMAEQPIGIFGCHQQNGRLCAGWVGCHDMDNSLALRLACSRGDLTEDALIKTLDYTTDVPLWASGQEAHDHGVRDIASPSAKAQKTVAKLVNKLNLEYDK